MTVVNTDNSLSVYFQVYSNKRAVFECLRAFRTYYPSENITLVSDNGDDFSEMVDPFGLNFHRAEENVLPQGKMAGIEAVRIYLSRIYQHCSTEASEWVLLMEEDVQTTRRIKNLPATDCAGPRMNPYSPELTRYLTENFGSKDYGYGMCGGSIFKRRAFVKAFEDGHDFDYFVKLDNRLAGWSDLPLTLIFQLSGFNYSIWDEVSERTHPISPIAGDAAFDHAFKYWYGMPYSTDILNSHGRR